MNCEGENVVFCYVWDIQRLPHYMVLNKDYQLSNRFPGIENIPISDDPDIVTYWLNEENNFSEPVSEQIN